MNLTDFETAPSKAAYKIRQMDFEIAVLNIYHGKVYCQIFYYLKCLFVSLNSTCSPFTKI